MSKNITLKLKATESDLADQLERFIARYLILPDHGSTVLTLWILHTHAFDAAAVATPYLLLESPEKRCGKSRTLDVLNLLCHRGWQVAFPSPAVLYRKIEADCPTLLFDEIDSLLARRDEGGAAVREIALAGNTPGAVIPRMERAGKEGKWEPRDYSVYCPKVFAGIHSRRLPPQLRDRSITITLRRRRIDEPVERLRIRDVEPHAARLRKRAERWAKQNLTELRRARPTEVDELDDRAADAWEPLLAIADRLGGDWPKRARSAARHLSTDPEQEEGTAANRLLSDLHALWKHEKWPEHIRSTELLEHLHELEEAPWKSWGRDRAEPGLTARDLAMLLDPYGLKPTTFRDGKQTHKGYALKPLGPIWQSFCPDLRLPSRLIGNGVTNDGNPRRKAKFPVTDPRRPAGTAPVTGSLGRKANSRAKSKRAGATRYGVTDETRGKGRKSPFPARSQPG